ncbi:X-linked retinitis pigmentosa GTPase regulator-interacting protein 1, partial [Quaeritorhiza haematococci]
MYLRFCRSSGIDFVGIATCQVLFKDMIDPHHQTQRLRYYGDLISTQDENVVIGKVDFSLRARIPMAQAVRAYKERTVALNLLTVGDKEETGKRFSLRADMNDLIIRIIQCTNLRVPYGRSPAAYIGFRFYTYEEVVSDTVPNSTSPMFNYVKVVTVPMTGDLDRYLRTSKLYVSVLDDGDDDFLYGVAEIPLRKLAVGEGIEGEFDIKDEYGFRHGSLVVSMAWDKAYKPDIVP